MHFNFFLQIHLYFYNSLFKNICDTQARFTKTENSFYCKLSELSNPGMISNQIIIHCHKLTHISYIYADCRSEIEIFLFADWVASKYL